MIHTITLYTTHCPKCMILEQKLKQKGIQYETCTDENKMIDLGFMSAPMLQVGEQILDYNKAIKWVMEK